MLDIKRKFDISYQVSDHEWVLRTLLNYKVVIGTFEPYTCEIYGKKFEKVYFRGCMVDQKNFDDLCDFLKVALKVRATITF